MIASLEWRIALRARRLFALNIAIPLLLVAPIALGGAPRVHAAVVYTVFIALFGTFGSAIPLVRDADSGLFGRLALAGVRPARLLGERILTHAGIDALQLLPALAVIALSAGAGAAASIALVAAAALTLVVANAVGTWIAAAGRSIAEAALFAAVLTLFLLHLSGVFRTPVQGSAAARAAGVLPWGRLHDAVKMTLGLPAGDAAGTLVLAAIGATVALAASAAAARTIVRALAARVPE